MAELKNGGDPLTDDFSTGPAVGEALPAFSLPDQNGTMLSYPPNKGKALVLFYRSASW